MKHSILLSLLICFFLHHAAIAQGVIRVNEDPKVAQMVRRYVEINKSTETVNGWRIQLLATTERQRMESALYRFKTLYPNIPVDWTHAKPYYKIRAGAFATKMEAMQMLYILKLDYPTAYPAQDNRIHPDELIYSN